MTVGEIAVGEGLDPRSSWPTQLQMEFSNDESFYQALYIGGGAL